MTASQLAAPAFTRFALVFGVGFVLGTVRVLWIAPQLGARAAELAEAPVMLVVIYFAARWIAKRFCRPAVSDGARRHRANPFVSRQMWPNPVLQRTAIRGRR